MSATKLSEAKQEHASTSFVALLLAALSMTSQ